MRFLFKLIKRIVIIAIVLFICVQIYVERSSRKYFTSIEEAPVSDAILVLGARVYSNGSPSPVLQDRLDRAIELYRAGKAPKILVSGDHGTVEYDEVNAMLDYLLERGIPREDIFLDHAGFNTYDSIYRAKEIFKCDSIIISTQEFHMGRSLYIARRLGLDAYGVASANKAEYKMVYNYARESVARVKAVWDTDIARRLPRYLGDPIPITGDGTVTDG